MVEGAEQIPDNVDHGHGFSAGDRVVIDEENELYGGEMGEVYAVAYGRGEFAGGIVIDVLIDGTVEPERFRLHEVGFS